MNNIPLEVPEVPEPKISLKAKLDGKINYKSGFNLHESRKGAARFQTIQPDSSNLNATVKIGPGHLQTINYHNQVGSKFANGSRNILNTDYNAFANSSFQSPS